MERHHINDIRVILTDHKSKYQSGDYITGKVVISTSDRLSVSVIKINLSCIVEIKWVELPGLKSDGHNIHLLKKYLEYNYQLPDECMQSIMIILTFIII